MLRFVYAVLTALTLAASATPASAGCYEHCHQNANGDWVCHTNCY